MTHEKHETPLRFRFNNWKDKEQCRQLRELQQAKLIWESCPDEDAWNYVLLAPLETMPGFVQELVGVWRSVWQCTETNV